jgi:predicted glutamine amidotransferase
MCGITVGLGPQINLWKLQIISRTNDHRGGDGVGYWASKNGVHKWIENKHFSDFFENLSFFTDKINSKAVIMHTRKATKGSKKVENLHPFAISDKFIFCHNGTIFNINKLVEKYPIDVDIEDKVDSYLLGCIIQKHGYEVLKDYRGLAALVWTENNGKTLKFFRGMSKTTNYGQTLTEERPLWMIQTEKAIYFNSLEIGLKYISLAGETTSIKEIEPNIIFEYNDKMELVSQTEIDRTESFSCDEITHSSTTTYTIPQEADITTGKVKFGGKGQYYLDGKFFDKRNTPITGCMLLRKGNLIFNNTFSLDVDNENTFILKNGVIVDVDLLKSKNNSVTCLETLKKLEILPASIDAYTKLPVRYNSGYWMNSKSIKDICIKIPIINKYFIIKNSKTFISDTNVIEKQLDIDFKITDDEREFIKDLCEYHSLSAIWYTNFINMSGDNDKFFNILEGVFKQPDRKNNVFLYELVKILNWLCPDYFFNETIHTITRKDIETYLKDFHEVGECTLRELLLLKIDEHEFNIIDEADFEQDVYENPFDVKIKNNNNGQTSRENDDYAERFEREYGYRSQSEHGISPWSREWDNY